MDIPVNLRDRPTQSFGGVSYLVPWFVAKIGDRFDFRVIRKEGVSRAHNEKRCWLCGKPRRPDFFTFVIGPMCALNRISSEPPSHPECALYAVLTCPFLSNPKMRRSPRELPEHQEMAGVGLPRNPGVTGLWTTKNYQVVRVDAQPEIGAGAGVLFRFGEPTRVLWYRESRPATRKEVEESIDTGFPALMEIAMSQGKAAVMELQAQQRGVEKLLPKATVAA